MMTFALTRRTFLQLLGISASASLLTHMGINLAESETPQIGRTLRTTKVAACPELISHSHLLPDQIVTILSEANGWYQIPQGYVSRTDIQPMQPFTPQSFEKFSTAYWAEVVGSIASVRAHCAADAPLITRIGHGGVVQIVDALPGEPLGWYQLADQDGVVLGWSQAPVWRRVDVPQHNTTLELHIVIHRGGWLSVQTSQSDVLNIPFSSGMEMPPGIYTVHQQRIGGAYSSADQTRSGVGWKTVFGADHRIVAAYWHNAFGTAQPGDAVQLPPIVARWLYTIARPGMTITVV
jgi:hypothetical protein